MHRADYLGHHGITHLLGKSRQLVLGGRNEFRYHGNTCTGEDIAHKVGRHVATLLDAADKSVKTRYVGAVKLDFESCGLWRLHNLCQRRSQRHFVAEVYVAALQELLNLRAGSADAGQDGEDGFAALLNLLVQHVVNLVDFHQSWCAEDDHDGIDVVHLLAGIDSNAQMLGRSCRQDVDGVSHTTARQQL